MATKRTILYAGSDDIFYDDIVKFYNKKCSRDDIITEFCNHDDSKDCIADLAEKIIETSPHLVVIDFSKLTREKETINQLINALLIIKRHHLYKPIPIFAVFTTLEEFEELKFISSSGLFTYSHIKGENDETFFHDSFYIAYEENARFPKFAIASNLGLPHYFYAPSSITGIGDTSFQIESDIEAQIDEDIEARVDLFPEFKVKTFDVSFKEDSSIHYDYLYNAEFRIPFAGPWDEITEDSLQKDTFDTWLDFNKDKLDKTHGNILVVTNSTDFLLPFSQYQKPNVNLYFTSHLSVGLEIMKVLKPNLIIFSFDDLHDEDGDFDIPGRLPNSLNTLTQVISFIKSIQEYIPVIVTFNNPSSSEAIQKVFGYNSILSSPTEITMELVQQLLDNFEENYISRMDTEGSFKFKLTDNRRIIDIKREMIVTSITEHEITFLSEYEIPYYTLIKFDQPFEMFTTIIPPIRQLENQGNRKHYMGIIHTVSEVELQKLRQFVNYLIFKRPKEFYFDESLIDEELKRQMEQVSLQAENQSNNEEITKKEKTPQDGVVRESGSLHKSKL